VELKVKQQIGELVLQCIALQHRIEGLEAELSELKAKKQENAPTE
jgi:hypothetical protein